jgi:hypothetical protein
MIGVTMAMRNLKSQLVQVEMALAFACVLIGEISAGGAKAGGAKSHRRRKCSYFIGVDKGVDKEEKDSYPY